MPGQASKVTQKCDCGGAMVACGGGRVRCKTCHTSKWNRAPEVPPAPDGYYVKGFTPLQRDGETPLQWVKFERDRDQAKLEFEAFIKGATEKLPRERPVKAPRHGDDDLLNCYVITDYHLGMLSWREETGADWDLRIAEDMLVEWFKVAIACAPSAAVGVLAQLGDFLHWDGMDAVTPAHKNLLDADTRFQKLVRTAIKVLRRVIGMLLAKHERLIVVIAEGNHDPASSIWMREIFPVLYENEPRITVIRSPDPYYCIEHGDTSLFFHHGHKRRPKEVGEVFAAKFREIFGRTKHSYGHTGHLHHVDAKETCLMVIEQHRTLAAPDAFASRGGWLSGRDAQVITYHKRFGEVGRNRINSQMVAAA